MIDAEKLQESLKGLTVAEMLASVTSTLCRAITLHEQQTLRGNMTRERCRALVMNDVAATHRGLKGALLAQFTPDTMTEAKAFSAVPAIPNPPG